MNNVRIPGLPGTWSQLSVLYDYDADHCKCAACGGLGTPWAGWFNCEDCGAKSVVEDGRTFIKDE